MSARQRTYRKRTAKASRRKRIKRSARRKSTVGGFGNWATQPNVAHSLMAVAGQLTPIAARFASMSPQGAVMAQALSKAQPFIDHFRQDPTGAVSTMVNHPVGQQVLGQLSNHFPWARPAIGQAVQSFTNRPGMQGSFATSTPQYANQFAQNQYTVPQNSQSAIQPSFGQQLASQGQYNPYGGRVPGYKRGGGCASRKR